MTTRLRWIVLCLSGAAAVALAQSSGGDFEIVRSSLDGGGEVSADTEFVLTGAIGQPDAQPSLSVGGDFIVAGGLWARAQDEVFGDGFEDA